MDVRIVRVKGVPVDMPLSEVRAFLAQAGTVESLKPVSGGEYLVTFRTTAEALKAAQLTGSVIGSTGSDSEENGRREARVVIALVERPESEILHPRIDASLNMIYVQKLPIGVDNEVLYKEFGKFGRIATAEVKSIADEHKKGFGFVRFVEHSAAEAAIRTPVIINGEEIAVVVPQTGKKKSYDPRPFPPQSYIPHPAPLHQQQPRSIIHIDQGYPPRRPNPRQQREVFVGHLAPPVDEVALRTLLSSCGPIVQLSVHMNTNKLSQYAFATYETHKAALDAIRTLNEREFNGRAMNVQFRSHPRPQPQPRYPPPPMNPIYPPQYAMQAPSPQYNRPVNLFPVQMYQP